MGPVRRLVMLAVLLAATSLQAAPVPRVIGYEGRLLRDGAPATGVIDVHFAIFSMAEGGADLWRENQRLAFTDGFYAAYIGASTPLDPLLFDGGDLFLELTIDGEALTPRERIASVGYALRADVATSVAGGAVDAKSIAIGGRQVLDATGRLTGPAAYTAGAGIEIDPSTNTISLPSGCASNQVLKWSGTAWLCGAPGATYSAGSGVSLDGTSFGLLATCTTGQVLKWDGSTWACAADNNSGSVTTVNASAPLAVTAAGSIVNVSLPAASTSQGGYLAPTDFARFEAGQKLQGNPVLTTNPTSGQVLAWNDSGWAPATPTDGTVRSVGVAAGTPISVATPTTTPVVSMAAATSVSAGYLAPSDWVTFNGKLGAGTVAGGDLAGTLPNATVAKLQGSPLATTAPAAGQVLAWNSTAWAPTNTTNGTVTSVSGAGPVSVASGTTTPSISIAQADGTTSGYLSSTDWTTFNGKLGATSAAGGDATGTFGSLTVARLRGQTISPTAPSNGQTLVWNGSAWTPATPTNGTVTSVSASGPLSVATGTTTPTLSIAPATSVSAGALSASDWVAFSGKLSAVTTDASLTGGGTSGAPLKVACAGTGTALTAAHSDHNHDGTYVRADGTTAFTGQLTGKLSVQGSVQVGTDATACGSGNAGALRFTGSALEVCLSNTWTAIAQTRAGSSASSAGASCKAILAAGGSVGDGTYWIDPDGAGIAFTPFQVWCDMTSNGGGWTLVMRVAGSSQVQYQTVALAKADLATVGGITQPAKLSDAEYNQLNPDEVWNICEGRQTFYQRNKATAWYSNHGLSQSCSYDRAFWTGMKKASTDPYAAGLVFQACGGASQTSASNWGVLSGIYVADGVDFGCYAGCALGATCTAAPGAYATGAGAGWGGSGYVLVR